MYRIFYRKNILSRNNGSWIFSPSSEQYQDVEANSKKEAINTFRNCMRVVTGDTAEIIRCEKLLDKEN